MKSVRFSRCVGFDLHGVFVFHPAGRMGVKRKMRNSSVLWLYRKKGSTIGLRDLSYRFDKQTMEDIQTGLGFRPQA